MIDTNKLIPQRKQSERLSGKTFVTIGLIKKDVVKIDSLLKEKLVLSKVRYSILRQKNERDRRSRREDVLESKKDRSQDYDVKSNKKRKGFGGFLGGILKAVLAGLGFTIFKSLPALLKIGRMIKTISTPLILGVTVFTSAIVRLARAATQVLPDVRGKDFQGASKKSINSGIDSLSRALIETAIAFAVGSAAGIGVSRLVRGKTYTKAGALTELREDAIRGRNIQKKNITQMRSSQSYADAIRGGTEVGLYADDGRVPKKTRAKTRKQINLDIDRKFSRSDIPMYDSRYTPEENFLRMSLGIGDFQETSRTIKKKSTPKEALVGTTTRAERNIEKKLIDEQTKIAQKKLAESAKVRIDRSAGRKKGIAIDFSDFPDPDIDMDELSRLDAEMRGEKPPRSLSQRMSEAFDKKKRPKKMNKAERLALKAANEKRAAARAAALAAKKRAQKLATKKGLSKLLFRFGGEVLEQSVKQTIKASVGVVPIIGDLIGFLLDVFLFGQPVGRAAFMATGSLLGGLIGGVFGLIGGPPGVLVGGILGGIGGDLLGGALYDLLFEGGVGARITDNLTDSFIKKGVKSGVGMGFMSGGYAPFGGIVHAGEFVIDADSTRAIERRSPGFLMALNKAKGSQVNEVLETYMSYGNEGEGSERLIPLPFEKIVTRTVVTNTGSKDDSSSPFMDLYRRG